MRKFAVLLMIWGGVALVGGIGARHEQGNGLVAVGWMIAGVVLLGAGGYFRWGRGRGKATDSSSGSSVSEWHTNTPENLFIDMADDFAVAMVKLSSRCHEDFEELREANRLVLDSEPSGRAQALKTYQKLSAKYPENLTLVYLLAGAHFYQGARAEALRTLRRAMAMASSGSGTAGFLQIIVNALEEVETYDGRLVGTDTRTHVIATKTGEHCLRHDRFTVTSEGTMVRVRMSAVDLATARQIRSRHFPAQNRIPRFTYFEVWTEADDVVGRDFKGDYEDIVSGSPEAQPRAVASPAPKIGAPNPVGKALSGEVDADLKRWQDLVALFHSPSREAFAEVRKHSFHQAFFAGTSGDRDNIEVFRGIPFDSPSKKAIETARCCADGENLPGALGLLHGDVVAEYNAEGESIGRQSNLAVDRMIVSVASCLGKQRVTSERELANKAFEAVQHYASLPIVRYFATLPVAEAATTSAMSLQDMVLYRYRVTEGLLLHIYEDLGDGEVITDERVVDKVRDLLRAP